MTSSLQERLQAIPVIPLIQANDVQTGIAIARALKAAGMPLVEVVQRTDASLECLAAIAGDVPDLVVGAGTVLTEDQAKSCMDAGAGFIVSPGLDETVVRAAQSKGLAVYPGILTPSELQCAQRLGLDTVKFFPASAAGGVAMLEALASVFRGMRFIPTGGISAENLAEYLALDAVLACGGSWMTPKDAIESGDFDRITSLAAGAIAIAASAKELTAP